MTRTIDREASPTSVRGGGSDFGIAVPRLSAPKGGGAIRGIGEKFAANPVTGTGAMTIPIATSPGRAGFGPQLSLSYDSGSGNGPFGFGWSLSLPAITRKTSRGLPRYDDEGESDVFLLAGAEDLVPVLAANGVRQVDTLTVPGQILHPYRPRTEGSFARIERWTDRLSGEMRWRTISRENVTTWYGNSPESRIADPQDPTRIFSWLPSETYDDKGNAMVYRYAAENDENVDLSAANERHRRRSANRYLKRILYGNRVSRLVQPELAAAEWLFEVVLDYGEHDLLRPTPTDDAARDPLGALSRPWARRPDSFSTYRSRFEVRTYRRCQRILMFHRFAELGAGPCLVRSTGFDFTDLDYSQPVTVGQELAHLGSTRLASFIQQVTSFGHVLQADGAYLTRSQPPLEFRYSKPIIDDQIRTLATGSEGNLPQGLDGARYQWVDLNGEGVSGILTEQAGTWFYNENQGEGRFGPLRAVAAMPTLTSPRGGQRRWLDLAGDGRLDLVAFDGPTPGFVERTTDETWTDLRAFPSLPGLRWDDPNLRFIDLNGDGHADVLITEHDVFSWHPSLAEDGFGPARKIGQAADEEQGPRLVFADGSQSVHLADMCGDGLTALVRIRNGEICYWPNLGYGHFGAKVTMDQAPWFDAPDRFDQRRVRLADIDGSGTNDIIYLDALGARIYFNQCGNSWSQPRRLRDFPLTDGLATVMTADLLGNGTACLVWSSSKPDVSPAPLQYIDLMGGQKPHLLIGSVNNLGAETRFVYRASTHFYLEDKAAGRPWVTKLPFPVHVVARVETYDHISRNRFVTRYAYHHGYFDGFEREFRGFGLVEQWDTETLAALTADGELPAGENADEATHVPPVYTKSWFHPGAFLEREHRSDYHAGQGSHFGRGEYYREPGVSAGEANALLLAHTLLPPGLSLDEEREACRALRGSLLRREVYAQDGSNREVHPYQVTEQNFAIRRLQPHREDRPAVFFVHPRETIEYHYERSLVPVVNGQLVDASVAAVNPNVSWRTDPRVTHQLTLAVDEFGNVLNAATVAYPRRHRDSTLPTDADREAQSRLHLTYAENRMTNAVSNVDDHRTPQVCEQASYELTGLPLIQGQERFSWTDVSAAGLEAAVISYEERPTPGLRQKRLLSLTRTLFRRDDLTAALPLGELPARALLFEGYQLALTPGLIAQEFQREGQPLLPNPAAMLEGAGADQGGYLSSQSLKASGAFPLTDPDDHWWRPSGRSFFSRDSNDAAAVELAHAREHFFLPFRFRDPFHTPAQSTDRSVAYDAYEVVLVETRDALGNRVTAGERDLGGNVIASGIDYRVLQAGLVMDANRNRTRIAFDALGFVVGSAVMGKPAPAVAEGDSLEGFVADLPADIVQDYLTDPLADPGALLGRASTRFVYDLFAYFRTRGQAQPQPAVVATLARETHDSEPVPPGGLRFQHRFSYSDGFGREIQKKSQAAPGALVLGGPILNSRWVASGWTIFNNKGKPVREYEPFFSATVRFEFGVQVGVSPILFYDPLGRIVATLHPNQTYAKAVFDGWRQVSWDVNDTVLNDPRSDPDLRGATAGYFASQPPGPLGMAWETWFSQRQAGDLGVEEQDAATKAAAHAGTPSHSHLDALGRVFLTVSDLGPNLTPAGAQRFLPTRFELDIQGRQRAVRDALDQAGDPRGRVVMRSSYDLLGNGIHSVSMEAGSRWLLNDVAGKPILAWDSRGHRIRTAYDSLRRPIRHWVIGADVANPNMELLTERLVYGEQHADAEIRNLRGRRWLHFDQAGLVAAGAHDFKGNLLMASRRLTSGPQYRRSVDWGFVEADPVTLPDEATLAIDLGLFEAVLAPRLETDAYLTFNSFDALNRPVEVTTPHTPAMQPNVIRSHYSEAGLLQQLEVNLRSAALNDVPVWTRFVSQVDYDAKGRRQRIIYGNGVSSSYSYDAWTSRLVHLLTRRNAGDFPADSPALPVPAWPGFALQNLQYIYDPVGNITRIRDNAQQAVYFRNRRVEPSADYTYDSLYRLFTATGREHLGQIGGTPFPHSAADGPRVGIEWSANDGNALGTYVERYLYDPVGNILEMQHRGSDPAHPGWTRFYAYEETSTIEDGTAGTAYKSSNRLTSTTVGINNPTVERYAYDSQGNLIRMPHLGGVYPDSNLTWDYADRLRQTGDGGDRTAYYVCDAEGRRVRKVWEISAGLVEERLYLGGMEIFRRRQGADRLERETLHIMDGQQRVALVETRTADTAGNDPAPSQLFRYQLNNRLGSACLELDEQARIISYEEFTPYGSTSYQAVRSQMERPKRYRYTGKERDEENGLYYEEARYYASWLGRWTSCDPTGLVDGPNLYLYTLCNPVRFTDKSGEKTIEEQINEIESPLGWFFAKTGYDIWNVASLGTLSKVEGQKDLGSLAGLGKSVVAGVTRVSNTASLGLQDNLYDTQLKEGFSAQSLLKAVVNTTEQNLPVAEAEIIADPNRAVADRVAAGFTAVSKVASLIALGAGLAGRNPVVAGPKSSVGVGFAGPGVGHTAVTLGRAGRFFDKVVGRNNAGRVRDILKKPDAFQPGRPLKYSEVEVPAARRIAATEKAQAQVGPQNYSLLLDNCGTFTGEILGAGGIQVLTLTPSLLNWNFRFFPHLGGALINTAAVSAEVRAATEKVPEKR